MTAPQATEQPVAPPPTEPERLHRPVRAVVALAEVLAAAAAIWGAFWAWPRGFSTITTVISDGTVLESQRVYGNWLAVAIGFGTVAALLVLDALRQALLAVRAKPEASTEGRRPCREREYGIGREDGRGDGSGRGGGIGREGER